MSEWNLSVRLDGQGSGLRRMLRDTSRDARTASRAVNQLRDDIADLRDEARRPIRLRVRLDAGRIRDDVRRALNDAEDGQGLAVGLRIADPMQLRRDVSAAVRWASMNQTVTVRVNPDTSALNGLNGTLNAGGGSTASSGAGASLKGLLLLAPAAVPLIAGLSTSLAPLPGLFGAAGAGATAFGVALAGQIGRLSEVADAEKKYQEAVRENGRTSAEAMEAQRAYQQMLAQLPPEAQQAAVAVSQLKQNFKGWSDDMAAFTMEPVTNGITVLDQIIPRLTPHVQSSSAQLKRLIDVVGGGIQTPGFDAMADRFADFTDRQLTEMTDKVIHFMRVISEGRGPGSGPISEFIAYAKDNAPAAREALSAISAAVVTLLRAASEAGPSLLSLVTAAAQLVSALPPELVGIIIQVATALKLLQLSGAGFAALAGLIGRVRASIVGLGAASAGAGGGLLGLRAAFLALGTAAKASVVIAGIGLVAAAIHELMEAGEKAPPDVDRLTTSLGNLGRTGKATGYVAQQFGADFSKLNDQIKKVTDPSVIESINNWGADITGGFLDAGDATEEFTKNTDSIDESLTNLVRNGNAKLAAAALAEMTKGLDPQEAKKFRSELGGYDQALADLAFEQKHAAESQGIFGQAAQDTKAKLDAQKASADGLRQSIIALNEVNRAAGSAMSAFEQSIDDATEATKDHAGALKIRDGDLDLGSAKSREAEKVLSDLAANTDAAATAAREQGRSWEYVQGIMTRGQEAFVQAAQKMGLTKAQAEALAQSYLKIPAKKSTVLEMRTEDAINGLNSVIAAIQKTPGKKSVTVDALTSDAIGLLRDLGFTVKQLPDGRFKVTADTAAAKSRLADVQRARDGLKNKSITLSVRDQASAQARAIQRAIDSVRGKTVTIQTVRQTLNVEATAARNAKNYQANGSVLDFYADGGIQRGGVRHFARGAENHVAQIAPAGSWRVWGEPETHGEGYVPFARSKRVRSRAITEEIVRRLGGDPAAIQWNADGNVTDWRYDPQTGSLYSASDAGQAGHKTRKVKTKVKGKWRTKEVEYFDITAVEKKLRSASKATQAWNADLQKVADRVGGDVAEALASMGRDGMKLADKMAHGSTKYINDMAKALRNLQKTAKASLTDYTRQLGNANKLNKDFADDLAKLAAMGYGDLAAQLAEQNDTAAQQLADAASKDRGKAAKANAAAKTANNALTADQVQALVQIIAAIKTSKTGIHDVAGTTGLGEDEIIAVANKAKGQISSSLGSRSARFLADLGKANKHLAYADGGIRAGIYATQAGIIRFGEPETHGEAYVPLGPNKRRSALPVLADVAHRFGLGLADAQAARPVVIVRGGGDTNVNVTAVRTGASASEIGAQVGRSVRRARRGGVAARAA